MWFVLIHQIPVCRPKTEYRSLHSSHALRCLAVNFFAKGAVSNEACISGKALGCHEPLKGDLPILSEHWQYQVFASTKKQFGILKKLMQRKDVESLICTTDAGREGELIFRLVYQQAGCKKPVERLWISSMEDSAIREGFQKLRSGTEYDALYEAALCWERAD